MSSVIEWINGIFRSSNQYSNLELGILNAVQRGLSADMALLWEKHAPSILSAPARISVRLSFMSHAEERQHFRKKYAFLAKRI